MVWPQGHLNFKKCNSLLHVILTNCIMNIITENSVGNLIQLVTIHTQTSISRALVLASVEFFTDIRYLSPPITNVFFTYNIKHSVVKCLVAFHTIHRSQIQTGLFYFLLLTKLQDGIKDIMYSLRVLPRSVAIILF